MATSTTSPLERRPSKLRSGLLMSRSEYSQALSAFINSGNWRGVCSPPLSGPRTTGSPSFASRENDEGETGVTVCATSHCCPAFSRRRNSRTSEQS